MKSGTPIAGLMLAALALAGCGGNAAPTSAPSPASPASSAAAPVAKPSSAAPAASASAQAKPAISTAASAAASAAVTGPPMKVNIAYNTTELQHLPIQIAIDQKLFAKYGLDAQVNAMEGGTEMSKVLLAGKLDFIVSNVNEVADAHAAGEDERIVADSYDVPTDALYGGPSIKSKDQIKGKKLGISKFGGASELTARLLIRKVGLDDTKDVTIVQIGGESSRIKAALAGTVDVVPADSSEKRLLERQGLTMVETLADPNGPGGDPHGLVTTGSVMKKSPEMLKRMVMAYGEGMWLLKNKPEIARASIEKMANTTDAAEVADIQKQFGDLQKIPPLSDDGKIAYTLNLIKPQDPKAASQKPADLFDNSVVQELVKAGFFEQLGR